jgi:hypothetical protein
VAESSGLFAVAASNEESSGIMGEFQREGYISRWTVVISQSSSELLARVYKVGKQPICYSNQESKE